MKELVMEKTEIDQLAQKFGGRYKLTVLIQKRLKELVKGGVKLVETEDRNLINIVLEEIRQGKVSFEGYTLEEPEEKEGRKSSKKKE
jgi:DNA-directed RNA polymerase subunit omega